MPDIPTLTLACACDDCFVMPAVVMLQSVMNHVDPDRQVEVWVIAHELSDANRDLLQRAGNDRLTVHLVNPAHHVTPIKPQWGRVTAVSYDKLFAARFFPKSLKRVLWLDCDLLVREDVGNIFDLEFGQETLMAVLDPMVPTVSSRFGVQSWCQLGLPSDAAYFNAGVMLIDLEGWREQSIMQKAMQLMDNIGPGVVFHEQEILNALFAGEWRQLEDRWNLMNNPMHARLQTAEADSAAIIHFSGNIKPWGVPDLGTYQQEWFAVLDQTACEGVRPARNLKVRLLSAYVTSPLRRLFYRLENLLLWYRFRRKRIY